MSFVIESRDYRTHALGEGAEPHGLWSSSGALRFVDAVAVCGKGSLGKKGPFSPIALRQLTSAAVGGMVCHRDGSWPGIVKVLWWFPVVPAAVFV